MALNDPTDKDNKKNKIKCKKLCELTDEDIEEHLEKRLSFTGKGIDIYSRYLAYDYCYNCFRDIHEDFLKREEHKLDSDEMETLCLQLGLFLGTWGMFRNSDLLTNNFRIYELLIERIFEEEKLWNIDVKDYCDENGEINPDTWKAICCFKKEIQRLLGKRGVSVTDTLATKIMMVVFGCVPAYDRNFRETVVPMSFGKNSLEYIYKFYNKNENKKYLDKKQKELKTVRVEKGDLTDYTYTMAKIIDIIGFHVTEKSDIEKMKNTIIEEEDEEGKKIKISKWDKKEKQKNQKKKELEELLDKLESEIKKDC